MASPPEGFRALPKLQDAWREPGGARVKALQRAAAAARDALLSDGTVAAVTTCPLVTFPYPTLFAFSGGARSPAPFAMLTHRMMVVQFESAEGRKTLLFNASDVDRGNHAPFFAELRRRFGDFVTDRVASKRHGTVEGWLAKLGLRPEDVDYLAYDHLHLQDVRGWLGGEGAQAFFPRAQLLVARAEWALVNNLHPMQRAWYVPDGMRGVPEDRVVLLDGDAWLGTGAALVLTPGHTAGNMSLAVATDRGLFLVSENGVATECYSPERSEIPGLRGFAEHMGWEVVLDGNTREHSLDQYSSMLLEKALAGPSQVEPGYVNVAPSSELTPSLLAPGLSPSFSHGLLEHGILRRPVARRAASET